MGTNSDLRNSRDLVRLSRLTPLDLLDVLVRRSPAPEYSTSGSSEQIILDGDVDGSRYLVVRLAKPDHTIPKLSPREQEIVRMVAQGHPNKVIAAVLNISSWTVCTHLRRIFAKLGVASRAAMVARLMEAGGLVEHPDITPSSAHHSSAHNSNVPEKIAPRSAGHRRAAITRSIA